ncbi:MAG TPA: N-acetylmuramoyl-L-alanine amidase [Candidatus Eisenbacteria bacterium]|nr:N-acetylmuramoyl-L-alanine amidase [Candidatus Eisenbacteria bacterium]
MTKTINLLSGVLALIALTLGEGSLRFGADSLRTAHSLRTADSLEIDERPLPWNCSAPRPASAVVDVAVIHFSSNAVKRPKDPYRLEEVLAVFRKHKVSAHYMIDREGGIHRLVDESRSAFHAGKGRYRYDPARTDRLNETSIGIEILAVGSAHDMLPFMTEAGHARIPKHLVGFAPEQYASLKRLLADLHKRYPQLLLDSHHVIGHDEYAPGRKTDPGELFDWEAIGVKLVR